jgi:NAD(P)-dependent dehydrogenase (short-subunit alcohol dehydrogenase family)
MRARGGGTIVNIGSEAGVVAVRGQVVYNVSKAAIAMLTRSIAVDHAGDGIRAITISPGTTRTPLVAQAIASAPDPEAHERMLAESRPAKRLGRPEEIAAAVAFVAGGEVDYMTGAQILIDGGYTAQ